VAVGQPLPFSDCFVTLPPAPSRSVLKSGLSAYHRRSGFNHNGGMQTRIALREDNRTYPAKPFPRRHVFIHQGGIVGDSSPAQGRFQTSDLWLFWDFNKQNTADSFEGDYEDFLKKRLI